MNIEGILKSVYLLLGNIGERELDYAVALECLRMVYTEMKMEEVLGYRNEILRKGDLVFDGINQEIPNTLPDFAYEVVYCRFKGVSVDAIPPNFLLDYARDGRQAFSFFEKDNAKIVRQVFLEAGGLEVWYEPTGSIRDELKSRNLEDLFVNLIAIRTAQSCLKYVNYDDPRKEARRSFIDRDLMQQSLYARDLWKERVNRVAMGNRNWTKRPFKAG